MKNFEKSEIIFDAQKRESIINHLISKTQIPFEEAEHLAAKYRHKIDENTDYIKTYGIDRPELDAWVWPAARGMERVKEEEWHGQTN